MTDKSDDRVEHLNTILARGGWNFNDPTQPRAQGLSSSRPLEREGREEERRWERGCDPTLKSSNARGVPVGWWGMSKFRFDRRMRLFRSPLADNLNLSNLALFLHSTVRFQYQNLKQSLSQILANQVRPYDLSASDWSSTEQAARETTVEPPLTDTSRKRTPPISGHKLWSRRFLLSNTAFLTSHKRTPLVSGHGHGHVFGVRKV